MEQPAHPKLQGNNFEVVKVWNKRFGAEVFWSGVVGIFLGLVSSLLVWYLQSGLKTYFNAKQVINNVIPTKVLNLVINEPEDGFSTSISTIKISGNTQVPAKVILTGGVSEKVIDSEGTFSTDYELNEGENDISVVSFSSSGETSERTISVLYLKELE